MFVHNAFMLIYTTLNAKRGINQKVYYIVHTMFIYNMFLIYVCLHTMFISLTNFNELNLIVTKYFIINYGKHLVCI